MPILSWVGKDKVKNHHHDVPFRLLNTQYTFTANEGTPANSTGNKIIHGDNLEALKSLLPEFEGKVNCIYIDPPYNTGNEGWVYNDNVNDPKIKKWLGQVVGKEGEDLSRHDKWLCMMYPRLKLLHRLLADDGVIFISIDDNEQAHLKLVMDEVFGAGNFVGQIVWKNVTDNNPTKIAVEHEYVICFGKNKSKLEKFWKSSSLAVKELLMNIEKQFIENYLNNDERQKAYSKWFVQHKAQLWPLENYKFIDEFGIFSGERGVHNPGKEGYRYDIIHPVTQKVCKEPLMGYRFPEETMKKMISEGRIIFGETEDKLVEIKVYVREYKSKLSSFFELDGRVGTNQVKNIFLESSRPFDYL